MYFTVITLYFLCFYNLLRLNALFFNIPESRGEDCQDIIYDLIENDLKINAKIFVSTRYIVLENLQAMKPMLLAHDRS